MQTVKAMMCVCVRVRAPQTNIERTDERWSTVQVCKLMFRTQTGIIVSPRHLHICDAILPVILRTDECVCAPCRCVCVWYSVWIEQYVMGRTHRRLFDIHSFPPHTTIHANRIIDRYGSPTYCIGREIAALMQWKCACIPKLVQKYVVYAVLQSQKKIVFCTVCLQSAIQVFLLLLFACVCLIGRRSAVDLNAVRPHTEIKYGKKCNGPSLRWPMAALRSHKLCERFRSETCPSWTGPLFHIRNLSLTHRSSDSLTARKNICDNWNREQHPMEENTFHSPHDEPGQLTRVRCLIDVNWYIARERTLATRKHAIQWIYIVDCSTLGHCFPAFKLCVLVLSPLGTSLRIVKYSIRNVLQRLLTTDWIFKQYSF